MSGPCDMLEWFGPRGWDSPGAWIGFGGREERERGERATEGRIPGGKPAPG
jgi:hypothetical protein